MALGTQTHAQSQQTMVNAMMEEVGGLCESPEKKPLTECVGWGPLRRRKPRRLFVRGRYVGWRLSTRETR